MSKKRAKVVKKEEAYVAPKVFPVQPDYEQDDVVQVSVNNHLSQFRSYVMRQGKDTFDVTIALRTAPGKPQDVTVWMTALADQYGPVTKAKVIRLNWNRISGISYLDAPDTDEQLYIPAGLLAEIGGKASELWSKHKSATVEMAFVVHNPLDLRTMPEFKIDWEAAMSKNIFGRGKLFAGGRPLG